MRNQRKWILSPCGMSLLTWGVSDSIRRLLSRHANAPSADQIPASDRVLLQDHLYKRKKEFLSLSPKEAAKWSAEIHGIYRIYQGDFSRALGDVHVLLATETWLGKETARIVQSWLQAQGIFPELWDDLEGLRTDSLDGFHRAIGELIGRLHEQIPAYQKSGYRILFNLTGGFKSIQGILQTLAQFYADEAIYIFETSTELLRIPKIPIKIDLSLFKNPQTLKTWRRIVLGLPVPEEQWRSLIPETLLWVVEKEPIPSVWGELLWKNVRQEIYGEAFHEPPSDRIRYSESLSYD